ncbi:MAG: DNA-binding response regulator [Arcobacter sp.]|nr:DNA-binding response regulator [Arcobacter sp.]|tara:strand:+ start:1338 stop:2000 length:663 start_codon:yes stop_codon:yes gene_type:complete
MKILLLEDDPILNEIIEEHLLSLKYLVTTVMDGETAEEFIYDNSFDLLLLDVNVPNINGFDLLKKLRENNINIPAIFITSRNSNDDMKIGFNAGADDYIRKPFDLFELELRIKNIKRLRQIKSYGIIKLNENNSYNIEAKTIINKEDYYTLSKIESKIFEYFIKNKNKALSIEEISINNWIYDEIPEATTIRTYIKNLRKKLDKDTITTIKGIGYKLNII